VFVVALVGGLCIAGVRGLETWRVFRRFRRRFGDGTAGMLTRLETLERRMARASATGERLDGAMAELNRSLAKARVLTGAAGETKELVDRMRGLVSGR